MVTVAEKNSPRDTNVAQAFLVPGLDGKTLIERVLEQAIGYWPLQDDAASTVVINNNGTNGVLVGGDNTADISTTGPNSTFAKALALDGVSDWVDTNLAPNLANGILTISGWVNVTGGASTDIIASRGYITAGWGIGYDSSGRVTAVTKRAASGSSHYGVRGQTDIRGGWVHLIVELDYTTATPSHRIWLDNVEETYTEIAELTGDYGDWPGAELLLGSSGSTDNLVGSIAGFAIWDRSLTPAERAALLTGTPYVLQGGTETVSGVYKIHTFLSSGELQLTGPSKDIEYLVVGGGGSGGGGAFSTINGGGGGAGAVKTGLATLSEGTYAVTVGNGGAATGPSVSVEGNDGQSSIIAGIATATGGGGGGSPTSAGRAGACGGGGGAGAAANAGGTGSYGYDGGAGFGSGTGSLRASGGGGGSGFDGTAGTSGVAGVGGPGGVSLITGSAVTYGVGGNGTNSTSTGVAGTANRGNGGQGGKDGGGGAGGSGIVVVRYRTDNYNTHIIHNQSRNGEFEEATSDWSNSSVSEGKLFVPDSNGNPARLTATYFEVPTAGVQLKVLIRTGRVIATNYLYLVAPGSSLVRALSSYQDYEVDYTASGDTTLQISSFTGGASAVIDYIRILKQG